MSGQLNNFLQNFKGSPEIYTKAWLETRTAAFCRCRQRRTPGINLICPGSGCDIMRHLSGRWSGAQDDSDRFQPRFCWSHSAPVITLQWKWFESSSVSSTYLPPKCWFIFMPIFMYLTTDCFFSGFVISTLRNMEKIFMMASYSATNWILLKCLWYDLTWHTRCNRQYNSVEAIHC